MNRARVAQLFRTIAEASAELADELGAEAANAADEWVDQHRSPLGKRAHLEAVRDGRLPGFKPDRRRVLVRRRDIDAYLAKHPAKSKKVAPAEQPEKGGVHDRAARFRARLGLVRTV